MSDLSLRRTVVSLSVLACCLALILAVLHVPARQTVGAAGEQVTLSQSLVREGNDFATLELADPWDMDQYSDVSMYMNESNTAIHVQNIQVMGGVFSGRSTDEDAQFHTLFPGYQSSIPAGKTGARHPVQASFHCFFSRMQVQSSYSLDETRVWWFADNTLTAGQFGSGRASTFPFSSGWRFYAVDLNSLLGSSGDAWSARSQWQGLRIDPTTQAGVDFAVDWVRLTDCTEVPVSVTWSGISGTVEVWAGIGAMQEDFRVPEGTLSLKDCTPSSCVLDVQGWQPGSYYIGVKRLSDGQVFWTTQPLVIDPAPILDIVRPSFTSGDSLVWGMNGAQDIVPAYTICVSYFFDQGELDLVTQPPGALPGNCVSSGSSDPQVVLHQSGPVDTSIYRYLTFRTSMDGQWQDVNRGWMLRWIWSPYPNCFEVSNDIAFDVGWQSLTIDLHDPFEGLAEDSAAPPSVICPIKRWADSPATYLRFDPNENTTSTAFHQRVDWIRLSRMDRVAAGLLFPIQIQSTEPVSTLSLNVYYTTDPVASPRQHAALISTPSPSPPPGPNTIFLPMVAMNFEGSSYPTFLWDTSGVTPAQYYICVEAFDGENSPIFCSEAPVEVTSG